MARNLDHNKVQRIETPYGNGYYYNGRLYSDQDFKKFAEGGDIDEESESSKKSAKAKPGDAGYVPNKSNRDYGTKPTPKFELRKKATTTSDQPVATTTPEATPAPKYTKEYVDMVYTGKNRGDVSYTSMWQSDPEFQRLYDQYNQPSIPVTSQSSNVSQAAQNASALSSSDANEYGSDPYLESISKGGGQESAPTVNLTTMNLSGYAPDENSPEAKAMAQAQVQQGLAAYQRSTASTGNTGAAPVASTPAAKKTVAMTPSTPSVAPSLLDQQSSNYTPFFNPREQTAQYSNYFTSKQSALDNPNSDQFQGTSAPTNRPEVQAASQRFLTWDKGNGEYKIVDGNGKFVAWQNQTNKKTEDLKKMYKGYKGEALTQKSYLDDIL